jgi:hypothetical protein
MKIMKVTFVVTVLAVMSVLSGCVFVPVGPGYYSGHGHYYSGGRGYR